MRENALVALIDDHPATLAALRDLLDALQVDSLAFADAEAFLAHPARHLVTCIVLDIQLGGMSGLALKAALDRGGGAPPVIFLTSTDDAGTRARAAELGAHAFLVKPAQGSQLVDWLDRLA